MDENDDEDWRYWTNEPVKTFEEALHSIAEDGSWVVYFPVWIHPEYRAAIWELAQEAAGKQPARLGDLWNSRSELWRRLSLGKR